MSNNWFADVYSDDQVNVAQYASAGYPCLMIKATEGTGYLNPHHADQAHEAHKHGLAVFHYHFCKVDEDPHHQAEWFWANVRQHFIRPGDYCIWDWEEGSPETGVGWVHAADSHLTRVGNVHAGLYAPLSYLTSTGIQIASKRLHPAAWGSQRPGNRRWQLLGQQVFAWQYTDGRGYGPGPQRFAGIYGTGGNGTCDGNELNPSVAKYLRKHHR